MLHIVDNHHDRTRLARHFVCMPLAFATADLLTSMDAMEALIFSCGIASHAACTSLQSIDALVANLGKVLRWCLSMCRTVEMGFRSGEGDGCFNEVRVRVTVLLVCRTLSGLQSPHCPILIPMTLSCLAVQRFHVELQGLMFGRIGVSAGRVGASPYTTIRLYVRLD